MSAVLDPHVLRPGAGLAPPEPAAGAGITPARCWPASPSPPPSSAWPWWSRRARRGATSRGSSTRAPLAALVGACYVASALVFGWAAFGERWTGQRGLVVAVLGLAGPTLVATARHRDVFDFGRWQAVAWVVLFVASVTSFGTPRLVRPADGDRTDRARPAGPGRARRRSPSSTAPPPSCCGPTRTGCPTHGPVAAGPLGLRFIGSWAAFLAIGAAYAASHRRWREARMNVVALVVFPLAALGAAWRTLDDLRPGRPTVLWSTALALLTVPPWRRGAGRAAGLSVAPTRA